MKKRIWLSLLLGLLSGVLISEIPFYYLRETARPPQEITLTIPAGTAAQVLRGEQPPSIPQDMVFVVGDTLVVKNEDVVDHKLGEMWIPAEASASMALNAEENMAYTCSFQPGNSFGLDVRQPVTLSTRIYGAIYAGLPLSILLALYSFVIPPKKQEHVPA